MIKDDNFVELKSYKVISVNELVIVISNMTNRNILITFVLIQQIEDGLYCFLIPPNYDGTLLMKEMWTRAVLPETIARRARMYEEIRKSASFQEMSLPMREV